MAFFSLASVRLLRISAASVKSHAFSKALVILASVRSAETNADRLRLAPTKLAPKRSASL